MGTDTRPLALAPATVLVSDRPAGPAASARRDSQITFAGGLVTLGAAVLVALAVPFMVVALPPVMLALLVFKVVRARARAGRTHRRPTS